MMVGIRPLKYIEEFIVLGLGDVLEVPQRPRQPRARFRGLGPRLAPRVDRRVYRIAIRLKRRDGIVIEGYPLSYDLTRYQARKLLRRVRLTIPQAGIWTEQGVC